jgi:hypothetical protein
VGITGVVFRSGLLGASWQCLGEWGAHLLPIRDLIGIFWGSFLCVCRWGFTLGFRVFLNLGVPRTQEFASSGAKTGGTFTFSGQILATVQEVRPKSGLENPAISRMGFWAAEIWWGKDGAAVFRARRGSTREKKHPREKNAEEKTHK